MTLNQFGAVLSFAIELEKSLAEFYEQASEINQEKKSEYQKRANDSITRKKKLEKSRRENITEIILEPIEGLNKTDFKLNLNSFDAANIKELENIVAKFYGLAYKKVNVLETKRVLKKCAKQHESLSK
jgi:hypothetical protein